MTNQVNPSPGSGPGNPSNVSANNQTPMILGDGYVQLGKDPATKVFWDQLSPADQEKIIEYYLSAQIPLLPPPIIQLTEQSGSQSVSGVGAKQNANNTAISAIDFSIAEQTNKIITTMLNAWIAGNAEIAKQSKEASDKMATIKEAQRSYEIQQDRTQDASNKFIISFTMGVVLSGSALAQGVVTDPITHSVVTNPVAALSQSVIPPVFGDIRTDLGLIAGIFSTGILYGSVAEVAVSSTKKGEKPKGPEFALAYGDNMLDLINNSGFNAYLMSIITRSTEKTTSSQKPPLTDARKGELAAFLKIVLLSSAVAMIYKSTADKMSSIEFNSMLDGTFKFKPEDAVMQKLIAGIQAQIKLVSPHEKATLLAGLLDFFDSNPSMEILENPSKVFAALYPAFHHSEMVG